MEFDCLEKSLPLVPLQEAKPAFALVPFQQELNQETLKVEGLSEGRYALTIDGQKVGVYPAADLAQGINLAENERTPQYKQAVAAAKLNVARTEAARGVRASADYYYTISRSHTDMNDRPVVEKKLTVPLEEAKSKAKTKKLQKRNLLRRADVPDSCQLQRIPAHCTGQKSLEFFCRGQVKSRRGVLRVRVFERRLKGASYPTSWVLDTPRNDREIDVYRDFVQLSSFFRCISVRSP